MRARETELRTIAIVGEVAAPDHRTTYSRVRYPRAAALLVVRRGPVAGRNILVSQLVHVAVDFAELASLVQAAGNQHPVLAAALDGAPPVLDIHHSFGAVLRAVARATLDVPEVRVLPATFRGAGLETSWNGQRTDGCRKENVFWETGAGQRRRRAYIFSCCSDNIFAVR